MAEPHDPALPPAPQEPEPGRPGHRPGAGGAAGDGDAWGHPRTPGAPDWPGGAPGPVPMPPHAGGPPWPPRAPLQPQPGGGGRPLRNPLPPAEPSRRALAIELFAVFVIAFALPFLSLFNSSASSAATSVPPDVFAFSVLASSALQWFPIGILFFLLRRRGGWSSIGLTPMDPVDFTAGVVLWLVSHVTVFVLAVFTQVFGTNNVEFLPKGLPTLELGALSLVIALTAGFVEEILVRGYAQTRLQQLRAPAFIVVVVPTALWAVLHLYQGVGPAVTIFGLGLVYALWFQWTRRLWPVVIAHTLFDLTTLVLIIVATSRGG